MTTHTQASPVDAHLEQLQQSVQALLAATEEFIEGAGRAVELDLEYCEALTMLEEAVAEVKETAGREASAHG